MRRPMGRVVPPYGAPLREEGSPGTARKGGAHLVKAKIFRLAITLAALAALAAVVGAGEKW